MKNPTLPPIGAHTSFPLIGENETRILLHDTINTTHVKLLGNAEQQLKNYTSTVAHMCKTGPFHNFEKASHVVMSTLKILHQIEFPSGKSVETEYIDSNEGFRKGATSSTLYFEPLTQLAIIFAALSRDIAHSEMTSSQSVGKQSDTYHEKVSSEYQHIAIAWRLLMQAEFEDLQRCI
jgi:3'5'-cyclic nucleotide phosphodiesterase